MTGVGHQLISVNNPEIERLERAVGRLDGRVRALEAYVRPPRDQRDYRALSVDKGN